MTRIILRFILYFSARYFIGKNLLLLKANIQNILKNTFSLHSLFFLIFVI